MNQLAEWAEAYHQQALGSEAGMQYLQGRGLMGKTIRRFKVGWITDPVVVGTPEQPRHEKYRGQPVIPYLTTTGRCTLLKVRTGWPKPYPKYMPLEGDFPLSEPRVRLFNARHAMVTPRSDRVAIVEGEFDAMIAVQCGARAVAVPAATTFYERWVWLFEHSQVVICLDGDDAGKQGADKLQALFRKHRIQHEVRHLPTGVDLTDIFLAEGSAGVTKYVR